MRKKKIRGYKRRWKHIKEWIVKEKNLDICSLKKYKDQYTKVYVHPWSGLTFTFSEIPQPNKKTKKLILQGLVEIYNSWKIELDKLNEEYYLKIWLFEPRISKSQVVCAIQDGVDAYETTFEKVSQNKQFRSNIPDYLDSDINWECHVDYNYHQRSDLLWPKDGYSTEDGWVHDRRLLRKLENGDYKSEKIMVANEEDIMYFVPKGRIWIGSK